MKRMHKLIMTSAAYRQTARFEPSNAHDLTDPGNKLLWRFPPRRLSAEQVRDAAIRPTPDRLNTTTATQSLLLANSEWPLSRGRALAGRVLGSKKSPEAADVVKAYRMAWGRDASEGEVKVAMDFLAMQKSHTGESKTKEAKPDANGLSALGGFFKGAGSFLPDA